MTIHLFDKLRASFRRKSNKIDSSLSEQIEELLYRSHSEQGDYRLLLLRLVYEHRSKQFDSLQIPQTDVKRLEFERSMLRSLLAITSSSTSLQTKTNSSTNKSTTFQRSSRLYRSMPMATSAGDPSKRKTRLK